MKNDIQFNPIIKDWFKSQFNEVSPPQKLGWPEIAKGNHTLIFAPTGSGKTLAAFLWCIDDLFRFGLESENKLFEQNPFGVHTLYVSPLKALNNDIHRNLEQPLKGIAHFAKNAGIEPPVIRSIVRTGDTPSHVRQSMVKKPPHILITTPESLYLLLTSERGREIFRRLKYLIVDEIHAVSGNKRGVHLSLSIERLMTLCQKEPVRIGLSATQKPLYKIAEFLGGQRNSENRKVSIVDCGMKKDMDVKVISPVADFSDLPESTVWPAVYKQLYDLILCHKTTLVFANMRAHTEKIARKINEIHRQKTGNEEIEIAFAHHGSMSRETRYEVEERLKKGDVPAVIATASLELGIDIGSIDLVINLEAPQSVSGALQRVGRSGHLLTGKSKGRIIPLYPSDLDDALALSRAMKNGEIEESAIPENCLDVLAQQIVAEVSMKRWIRLELFNLVKGSYCYRNLSEQIFNQVIEMLSGRFADSHIPSLQPRITWDKVNDQLIARKGARLTAVMNGGTIPDRGYYGVYMAGSNTRLGEMEEEFVFESRIGDVFFLGNNEWRIDSIEKDRLVVTPMTTVNPRAPFWKGDIPYRGIAVSEKISQFREQYTEVSRSGKMHDWLENEFSADSSIIVNAINYLDRQKSITGFLPTGKHVILEIFRDAADEYNLVVHAPFGGRINAPWAIVLSSLLQKKLNCEVQYSFDDDGLLLRLMETTEEFPLQFLMNQSAETVEQTLIESLTSSTLFAIQFRYNAASALLLPRSQPGKRIPLWLQRLRSSDLLQTVQKYKDFPIITETYRSCLNDVFDLHALLSVVENINKGKIKTTVVHTPYPSPMASGLIFNIMSNNMYEIDRTRLSGDVASISSEMLADILNRDSIPAVITEDMVHDSEQNWQYLSEHRKATTIEDLFEIIEKLGPIDEHELQQRSKQNPELWIEELEKSNRILKIHTPIQGWISRTNESLYSNSEDEENILRLLKLFLQFRGPVNDTDIAGYFNLGLDKIVKSLQRLLNEKVIVKGKLLKDCPDELWCDRNNFAELYRKAIGQRRKAAVAVDRSKYLKFLLQWHNVSSSLWTVRDVIEKYRGVRFTENVFEREIIRSRLVTDSDYDKTNSIDSLISNGDVIVQCFKNGQREYNFLPRGQGALFNFEKLSAPEGQVASVLNFLKENGASFFDDLVNGSDLSTVQIQRALKELTENGLVTCDNFSSLKSVLFSESNNSKLMHSENHFGKYNSDHRSLTRTSAKKLVTERMKMKSGRWFLTSSFAVQGKKLTEKQRLEQQTRLLLQRHGILVKEMYRHEKGFLPWYDIFQHLKRLEWQGEIRRGYFIDGLSGIQFALPEVIELLEDINHKKDKIDSTVTLCTIDPALPFGGYIPWNILDQSGKEVSITRLASNHILFHNSEPIVYSENFGTRLWLLDSFKNDYIKEIISEIKMWLRMTETIRPKKKLEIELINNLPAIQSEIADDLKNSGFEQDGMKLVLWPSGL